MLRNYSGGFKGGGHIAIDFNDSSMYSGKIILFIRNK